MKPKIIILAFLMTMLLTTSCKTDASNLEPMYGNKPKTQKQIKADNELIDLAIKEKGSREAAAKHLVMRGWEYLHDGDLDTSMKRFNQAWLLNPNESQAYWGFGVLLGRQNRLTESVKMLKKAADLDPMNSTILADLAFSEMLCARQEKNNAKQVQLLRTVSKRFEAAEKLDKTNASLYFNWAMTLFYLKDYRKALEKYNNAEVISPAVANPDFKNDILKNLNASKTIK